MKKIALLYLFLLTIIPLSYSQISDLEKNALIDLYNSTNGDSWNNTWDLNENSTNWHGITVENNTITEINLSMNNLNGQIPTSIENLKSLQKLNLGFNKLNGTIPNQITSCTSLTSIQLFMNQIEGEIPANIGNLKKIKRISSF